MLINDGRECTKAVNQLLAQPKMSQFTVDGAVKVYTGASMFGHYDSRGGSSLLVNCRSVLYSCIQYNRTVGWPDLGDTAMEDLLTPTGCEVHFVGAEPQHFSELDMGYNEGNEGFYYARVQERWFDTSDKKWRKWEDASAWVFWKGPKDRAVQDLWREAYGDVSLRAAALKASNAPEIRSNGILLKFDTRLIPDSLGEDACGIWFYDVEQLGNDAVKEVSLSMEY